MNRGIYATATGMLAAQRAMDVVANNLANASTNGFKRDAIAFNDAMVQYLSGPNGVIGTLGSGAVEQAQYTVFHTGPISATGNPLDVALNSEAGAFAVQTQQGIRYTRDGSFGIDEQGLLVDGSGNPVLDERQNPIQMPEGSVRIKPDGEVLVDEKPVGVLGVFEGRFVKQGDNLFVGFDIAATAEREIVWKSLEGSNVNPVAAMSEMITLNRAFEMAQRSIQQQDDLTQKLIQSLQDR